MITGKTTKAPLITSLVCVGLLVFGIACNGDNADSTPVATSTTSAPAVAPSLTEPPTNGQANDRDEFVDTVKAQLEQIQTRADDITKEMPNFSEDERAKAQQRLKTINDSLAEIQSGLDNVPAASDQEYDALRAQIEDQVNNTMNNVQDLADELGI